MCFLSKIILTDSNLFFYLYAFLGNPQLLIITLCDPILNCEKEFEDEIDNKYTTLSMFSKNLRSYISSTEQLPDFFDKYFQIKKDYELNHLKWFMYKALIDAHTNQDKLV